MSDAGRWGRCEARIVPAVLLILLTAFAFSPVLEAEFVNLDDEQFVTADSRLDRPWTAQLFTPHYKPLVYLSWAAERSLFGLDPFAVHLDNLLLHLTSSAIAYLLVLSLLRRSGSRWTPWIAALAVGWWAVHPMKVESVAWASERKDVLFALFYLAALWAWNRALERGDGRWRWMALLLWLPALASKQTAITLPLALIALDLARGRSLGWRLVAEKWAFGLPLVAALWLFGFVAAPAESSLSLVGGNPLGMEAEGVLDAPLIAAARVGEWLLRLAWPSRLSPVHPHPDWLAAPLHHAIPPLAFAVLAALLFAAWRMRKRHALPLAMTLFFAATLLPALLSVGDETTFLADRYLYLPSLAVAVLLGWAGARAAASRFVLPAALAALAVVATLALLTHRQARAWQSSTTLWTRAVEHQPGAATGWYCLGLARQEAEDPAAAVAAYRQAVELAPRFADAWNNLGNALATTGESRQALAAYDRALAAHPRFARALHNRATVRAGSGDGAGALEDYTRALEIEPGAWRSWDARARLRLDLGDRAGALADSARAAELDGGRLP